MYSTLGDVPRHARSVQIVRLLPLLLTQLLHMCVACGKLFYMLFAHMPVGNASFVVANMLACDLHRLSSLQGGAARLCNWLDCKLGRLALWQGCDASVDWHQD